MSPDYQIPGRVPDDSTPRQAVSTYWKENFSKEPYYDNQQFFDDYEPAYRAGYEAQAASRAQQIVRAYEEVERELQANWETKRGSSKLEWEQASRAARRAWEHAGTYEGPLPPYK